MGLTGMSCPTQCNTVAKTFTEKKARDHLSIRQTFQVVYPGLWMSLQCNDLSPLSQVINRGDYHGWSKSVIHFWLWDKAKLFGLICKLHIGTGTVILDYLAPGLSQSTELTIFSYLRRKFLMICLHSKCPITSTHFSWTHCNKTLVCWLLLQTAYQNHQMNTAEANDAFTGLALRDPTGII